MAVLKSLLGLHFRLIRREWTADPVRSLNALAACVFAALFWIRLAPRAERAAAADFTHPGIGGEILLAGAFAAWCALMPLLGVTPAHAAGFGPARLRTQPVPFPVFAALAALTLCVHPALWLGMGAQWAAALPFMAGRGSFSSAVALGLYTLACVTAGWAMVLVASAGSLPFFRRRAVNAAPGVVVVLLAAALAAGLRLTHDMQGWHFVLRGHSALILSADRNAGLLAEVLRRSPPGFLLAAVRGEHPARACAALGMTALAGALAVWWLYGALARDVDVEPAPRRRRWLRSPALGAIPRVAPALGAAWARELRMLWRASDIRGGLVLSLVGVVLLGLLREVSAPFGVVWAHLVILASASSAFNLFGLDAQAVDRLRLMPLSSRQIMTAKCAALLQSTVLQLAPLWIACAWRFGFTAVLAVVLSSAASALGFALCGAWISLYFPAARSGRGANAPTDGGGAAGALTAFLVCGLGVAAGLTALQSPAKGFAAGAIALCAGCALSPWAWTRLGRRFDARFEVLRERLRA